MSEPVKQEKPVAQTGSLQQRQGEAGPLRLAFMGTPDFAARQLQALLDLCQKDARFELVMVVTQVDKKVGRKQLLTPPPVKVLAQAHKLCVLQPSRLKDGQLAQALRDAAIDLVVTAAYGRILPKEILDAPRYGCMNIHASLLPDLRGACPIQMSIVQGDEKTGITYMDMEEGLDSGAIWRQVELNIDPQETAGALFERLAELAAEELPKLLIDFVDGKIQKRPQDVSKATHVSLIKKEDAEIDVRWSAKQIARLVRGFSPWPGTHLFWQGKRLKILRARVPEEAEQHACFQSLATRLEAPWIGTLFSFDGRIFLICNANEAELLEILELQLEGKRACLASDFAQGFRDVVELDAKPAKAFPTAKPLFTQESEAEV